MPRHVIDLHESSEVRLKRIMTLKGDTQRPFDSVTEAFEMAINMYWHFLETRRTEVLREQNPSIFDETSIIGISNGTD